MSSVDFVVLPPGHGRDVTDFWGWDAHEVQLRCPDGVWVVIEEDVVPGGALSLKSTNLPRPQSARESSPSRKISTVELGIEPGTSWLVVRDSDHYTTRLVTWTDVAELKYDRTSRERKAAIGTRSTHFTCHYFVNGFLRTPVAVIVNSFRTLCVFVESDWNDVSLFLCLVSFFHWPVCSASSACVEQWHKALLVSLTLVTW
jgi:hypothetical protein